MKWPSLSLLNSFVVCLVKYYIAASAYLIYSLKRNTFLHHCKVVSVFWGWVNILEEKKDVSWFCTKSPCLWFFISGLRQLIFRDITESCVWVCFYIQPENFLPGFSAAVLVLLNSTSWFFLPEFSVAVLSYVLSWNVLFSLQLWHTALLGIVAWVVSCCLSELEIYLLLPSWLLEFQLDDLLLFRWLCFYTWQFFSMLSLCCTFSIYLHYDKRRFFSNLLLKKR